jgi:predicted dehydrogenase
MTARLRVGLIGAGLIGQAAHAPHLAGDRDRWDFVVVADPSTTVRDAVAARYAVPNSCATLEEAVALGLDSVVIAVPDAAHRDSVVGALNAGIHVLVEKPLALSVAEVDEIVAARGDRVVQVGYMKLYDPATKRFVALLRDRPAELVYLSVEVNDPDQSPFVDHLGIATANDVDPELIATARSRRDEAVRSALGSDPRTSDARAFGAFLDSLVHDVSLAHFVLRSLGTKPPLPLADAAYWDLGRGVSLDWILPGDGRAHLEHLHLPGVSDYRERVTAFCRDRILELTFPSPYLQHHPTRLVERRTDGGVPSLLETSIRVSYEEAFRNELRAFHDSITTGAPVRSSVEAARDDLVALIDAFRLAAGKRQRRD